MGNSIDATLPTVIKPMLFAYDEYQTYDLIRAEKISTKLKELCNLESLLGFSLPQNLLIERFTPTEYEWAHQYSLHFYNFIKDFSGTDFYDSFETKVPEAPITYSFLREYKTINFPEITIPSGDGVLVITWLEKDYLDTGGFNKADASFIKRYRKYIQGDVDYIVKLPSYDLLPCSVVISGDKKESIEKIEASFEKLSKGYLFKNLEIFLAKIKTTILKEFPSLNKVPSSISIDFKIDYSYGKGYRSVIGYNGGVYGSPYFSFFQFESVEEKTSASPPFPDTFIPNKIDKPDWYNGAGLIYANNDYWKNGNINEDIIPRDPFYQLIGTGTNARIFANFLKEVFWQGTNAINFNLESHPYPNYQTFRNVWTQELSFEFYYPGLIKRKYKKKGLSADILMKGSGNTYSFYKASYLASGEVYDTGQPVINEDENIGFITTYTFEEIYLENPRRLIKIYYTPSMSGDASMNLSIDAEYYQSAEEVPIDNEISGQTFVSICQQYYYEDSL